jgi:hypothetical protein
MVDPAAWFTQIINNIIDKVMLPILGGLVIIMFIWAGITFLTAQGDPSKIGTAKKIVIWAIIGIVVAFVAFSATGIVKDILGV